MGNKNKHLSKTLNDKVIYQTNINHFPVESTRKSKSTDPTYDFSSSDTFLPIGKIDQPILNGEPSTNSSIGNHIRKNWIAWGFGLLILLLGAFYQFYVVKADKDIGEMQLSISHIKEIISDHETSLNQNLGTINNQLDKIESSISELENNDNKQMLLIDKILFQLGLLEDKNESSN